MSQKFKSIGRGSLLAGLVVILFVLLGINPQQSERVLSVLEENQPGLYRVIEVIDGDTIVVDMAGTYETVRFIGLDTPEKNHPDKPVQCFAEAASRHLDDLIADSEVRLQADATNQNRDRYQRLLRYVYLPDGTLLNKQQILDGYGFAYVSFPFTKMDEFIQAEALAKTQDKGLWANCQVELDNGYLNTESVAY